LNELIISEDSLPEKDRGDMREALYYQLQLTELEIARIDMEVSVRDFRLQAAKLDVARANAEEKINDLHKLKQRVGGPRAFREIYFKNS